MIKAVLFDVDGVLVQGELFSEHLFRDYGIKIPGDFFENEFEEALVGKKDLKDVKSKIKEINRDSKKTSSSEALLKMQTELRDLERKKKRLRQEIFEVEDEIEERRDNMINAIKAKMLKAINESSIFTIKWKLV